MANLDSLGYASITNEPKEEALKRISQMRLSRRTPTKVSKPRTSSKTKIVQTKPSKLTANDAAELLRLLTGG